MVSLKADLEVWKNECQRNREHVISLQHENRQLRDFLNAACNQRDRAMKIAGELSTMVKEINSNLIETARQFDAGADSATG